MEQGYLRYLHQKIFLRRKNISPKLAGSNAAVHRMTARLKAWSQRKNVIFYQDISSGSAFLTLIPKKSLIFFCNMSLGSPFLILKADEVTDLNFRKLYGPVKPGQEEKEGGRREEVSSLFGFICSSQILFLIFIRHSKEFLCSLTSRREQRWWSRISSTSQKIITHW